MQKLRHIITIKVLASFSLLLSLLGLSLWIFAGYPFQMDAGNPYPMQFNTALCIALSSISILALPSRKRTAFYLSQFANLVAALSFLQYLTGINFNIDNLFGYANLNVSYPGRMAPNTALCLVLLNTAILMYLKCHSRIARFTQLTLVCVVFGLTLLASLAYFMEIKAIYLWSGLTAMSIHTALAIIFLSSSLIALFLLRFRKFYMALIETMVIVVTGTLSFILFWQFLYMDLENNVQRKIQNEMSVLSALPTFFLLFGLIITGLLAFINYLKHNVHLKNEKLHSLMQNKSQQFSEIKTRYERIYEYSPDMLLFIDTGNLVTECNETFVDTMGYFRKKGILGRNVFDVLHLKNEKIRQDIAKILKDRGAIKNLELTLSNLNGDEFQVMLKASPFLNEKKELVGYSFSLRDTSDIHALKQELMAREYSVNLFRENIALYDHILDETTDGWWDINLETRECRLSRKLLRSLGLSEKFSHSNVNFFKEHVIPEDFAIVENNLKQHILSKGRFPFRQELRYRHQNGKLVWIFCRGQGILDPDGRIRRIVGTHVDISALKMTQAKLSQKIKEMDLIDQSTHLILMSDDIDSALLNCLSLIGLTTPFYKGVLYRYIPAANEMIARAIWTKKEVEQQTLLEGGFPAFSYRYEEGFIGRVWKEGKSQLSRVEMEKMKAVAVNKWNKQSLDQVVAMPLFLNDKVECIFEFYPAKKMTINENELGLFDMLVTQLSLALERKKTDYLLKHLALHDELTQLPNRRACLEMLEMTLSRAKRGNGRFALMFLDLDGFKHVNDSFGHHIGDLLLVEVSQLFRKAIRQQDYLARLAGDEFIIIIHDWNDEQVLSVLANRLIQSLCRPLVLENNIVKVSVSIGCVTYPEAGKNIEEILRRADYAMYKVKHGGKNSFSGFRTL
ncbi:diguanylate cyclase domain-containing protein [Legionella birminghamensis]|nr:diguanylate cyclase [Legionella birminghamensis]